MKVPEIETARLRLRRFTPDDLEAFAHIIGDPEVMKYIGAGETFTVEGAKPHLKNFIEKYWESHSFGRWALVHKSTGDLIGHCGFRMLEGTPELVYLLAKQHWRAGLASEAASACLRYAFEELRLEIVVAVTKHENAASRRVLEKIGMKYERDARFNNIDCVYYSVTRESYQPDDSYYLLKYNHDLTPPA